MNYRSNWLPTMMPLQAGSQLFYGMLANTMICVSHALPLQRDAPNFNTFASLSLTPAPGCSPYAAIMRGMELRLQQRPRPKPKLWETRPRRDALVDVKNREAVKKENRL
jgi:hypothetical protein